ncbi:hypothetical protein [Mycolicibacterium sp. J2]|jgi:hypothetical protein|uniref:hypothetical protein n=1 Tax=Mycolicibacterium sp. J2 TaxID=2993511 RepID=UPI00224AFAF6|nr:hypothetical protein [Mycolicibacterium sp. J2]
MTIVAGRAALPKGLEQQGCQRPTPAVHTGTGCSQWVHGHRVGGHVDVLGAQGGVLGGVRCDSPVPSLTVRVREHVIPGA